MGLFDMFKKKEPPKKQKFLGKVLRSASYPYSKGFRGTRRVKLAAQGSDEILATIDSLKSLNPAHAHDETEPKYLFNFDGTTIRADEVELNNQRFARIFVDDKYLGDIWMLDDERTRDQLEALLSGNASVVHLKIETDVGIGNNSKGDLELYDRYIPYIFIK